jgi:ATP-dependent protease Clp ATPase subunit
MSALEEKFQVELDETAFPNAKTIADIQNLRQLHVEMDHAVAAAYGWTDLDLGHGFHETKQGVPHTTSDPARREVLARLLKLNHERYAEEVKQGLHEKKKSKATKGKKAVAAEDLLKYGYIPEFIGRLPMLATLTELDEEALVQILKEPKNSLVKQYQKLFDLEKVRLRFTDGSLIAIAKEALKRNTGARGLRAIMENAMLDIMYEVPSQPNVQEIVINEDVIYHKEKPIILYEQELKEAA